jgi:hypothetical protein
MIGMNNDRASSFLCSFQTFQTFTSSVLCACTTRDTEYLPDRMRPNPDEGHGPRFSCSNFILLGALTDARFFNASVFCHPAISPSSPVSSQENQSSSLVPHGMPECHLAFPRLGSLITSPLLQMQDPRASVVGQRILPTIGRCQPEADNHQRCLYRERRLAAHWPLTRPPWGECAGSA